MIYFVLSEGYGYKFGLLYQLWVGTARGFPQRCGVAEQAIQLISMGATVGKVRIFTNYSLQITIFSNKYFLLVANCLRAFPRLRCVRLCWFKAKKSLLLTFR